MISPELEHWLEPWLDNMTLDQIAHFAQLAETATNENELHAARHHATGDLNITHEAWKLAELDEDAANQRQYLYAAIRYQAQDGAKEADLHRHTNISRPTIRKIIGKTPAPNQS
jgi:hypothetical protein